MAFSPRFIISSPSSSLSPLLHRHCRIPKFRWVFTTNRSARTLPISSSTTSPSCSTTGLISIVDLDLIPYGNARIHANGSISCQHGPTECLLNTIEACAISAWSDLLELQYAEQTNSLLPPHQYVPLVVMNGQPLYEHYEDVETYISKAYEGDLPKACKELPLVITLDLKANRANRVSHASTSIF